MIERSSRLEIYLHYITLHYIVEQQHTALLSLFSYRRTHRCVNSAAKWLPVIRCHLYLDDGQMNKLTFALCRFYMCAHPFMFKFNGKGDNLDMQNDSSINKKSALFLLQM